MAVEIRKINSSFSETFDMKIEYLKNGKKEELTISGKFEDVIDNQGYEESWTCYAAGREFDAVYSLYEPESIDCIFARTVLSELYPGEQITLDPQLPSCKN